MNVLLLFNLTDYAAQPWLDAVNECISIDAQHQIEPSPWDSHIKLRGWIPEAVTPRLILWADFVIAFPDCTDLAVCGNKSASAKLAANPNYLYEAVTQAKFASTLGLPYIIENPVGRLSSMWRKPDAYYHPSDFGGYLPEDDVHPEYPDYIAARDAYPKKTGLWVGNGAVLPAPRPVDRAAGYSTQYKKLGGKSQKTKNIRSATPRGMAIAIYEANKHLADPA